MDDCLERIPFVSLIALILVVCGSGIMCGTNFEALRRTDDFFESRFYPIEEPKIFRTLGIMVCILTIIISLINVVIGAVTTGDTRSKVYSDKYCISCGLRFSRFLLGLSYLTTFIWLLLFVTFSVPVSLWVMIHVVCREETNYWRSISANKDERDFTYTFNLTHYGLYRRPLDTSLWSEYVNSPSAFTHLCQQVSTVGPLFASALIACFLVILGLNTFIACLSTASVRLQYFSEIDRYRKLVNSSPQTDPTCLEEYSLQPLLQQPMSMRSAGSCMKSNTLHFTHDNLNTVSPFMSSTPSGMGLISNPNLFNESQMSQQFYSHRPIRHSTYSHQSTVLSNNY
ncbi:Neuronal membrane glycoprotein M6-a isoform 2 [Schistosoma japonicum]|uniref:Neuronal membrane glycoprotein M6-a isoform 2 n=2 Tax=Schistosoma japonicum TaxID=6182 RepID=A0A4Z2DVW5_SCHJA|nr:neuronal membrane glycoprotein M6-b [Schistosoma japonicum]TNN20589.1 Neuronal membrane glycoprotein M6-a isoform 2 [Schistosoma japonicum]